MALALNHPAVDIHTILVEIHRVLVMVRTALKLTAEILDAQASLGICTHNAPP